MRSIFFIATIFLILGCNKENLTRPALNGSHTASWMANEEVFKTDGDDVDGGPSLYATIKVSFDGPILNVVARNTKPVNHVIDIKVTNYKGPGMYLLNDDKNFGRVENEMVNYTNLATRKGYIHVMVDDGGVLAGTFEFLATRPGWGDAVTVTKGRFDIRR